jgi:hypothetical protein
MVLDVGACKAGRASGLPCIRLSSDGVSAQTLDADGVLRAWDLRRPGDAAIEVVDASHFCGEQAGQPRAQSFAASPSGGRVALVPWRHAAAGVPLLRLGSGAGGVTEVLDAGLGDCTAVDWHPSRPEVLLSASADGVAVSTLSGS